MRNETNLTILVPAHNEENTIKDCLNSLKEMNIPDVIKNVEYVVIDDRSEDNTNKIAVSLGFDVLTKSYHGDYVSAIAETMAHGVENTEGVLILKCDADIQDIPKDALEKLIPHLSDEIRRVSGDVVSRSKPRKMWLDFLFFLRDLNYRVTLSGREPRGAFTLFERRTVDEVGGFDRTLPTWDTAFDRRIKAKGWKVRLVEDVIVTEKRNFTLRKLVNHQIRSGRSRRKLGASFFRTLAHSIFRIRIFVIWGYLSEVWSEYRRDCKL